MPEVSPLLSERIKKHIIASLANDLKSMPLNILVQKVLGIIRKEGVEEILREVEVLTVLRELEKESSVGRNRFGKYFIDYMDYPTKDEILIGEISVDRFNGNGYIRQEIDSEKSVSATHFIHRKNVMGAKEGDLVEFSELVVSRPRKVKFELLDGKVIRVLNRGT